MTVIVTDAKYRAAVAAVRSLAKAGHTVVLTQTQGDSCETVPAFKTKYAARTVLFDCSVGDELYKEKLSELIREYERPTVFPIGAATLSMIVHNKTEFEEICRFAVPSKLALDVANDKEKVRLAAEKLGIDTPRTFESGLVPCEFPVIVKPRCGEKFGLSAKDRYIIAKDLNEYITAYEKMERYGGTPVVQQLIRGTGTGVSLLMDGGRAVSAICHKRIREYPASGGPSACCVSFYDDELVKKTEKLLSHIGFTGIAMVEYKSSDKGDFLLEINPRIWGSFPLTHKAHATFADDYVKLANGESIDHSLDNYKVGVKMNFILSDLAAVFDLARHGKLGKSLKGLFDIITFKAKDAMYAKGDSRVFWSYLGLKLGFKKKR